MLRLILAFAVTLVLGFGTAFAQDPAKKPSKAPPPKSVDEIFKEKDTNKDGKLSKDEFLKDVTAERKQRMERRFAAMDTDKDGSVTKEEMKAGLEKMKEQAKKDGQGGKGKKGGK